MDFLVEYSKTIYFHRALNVWLQNTEILPKQKGVLPFSKVVTFTLKTLEFSRKLSILLQFKTIFRPVTNISGVQLFNENQFDVKITKMTRFCLNNENIKFSSEIHSRLVSLFEKLQFSRKIMKITDFNEIGGKYQIFQ